MADSPYNVRITSTNDPSGTQAAKAGLEGVTAAAKQGTASNEKHASSARESAHQMTELAHATHRGAQVGEIFREVSHGNIAALLHLNQVLRGVGTALKANIIGLLLGGGMALVTFAANLRKTKEETDAAGNAAGDAAPKVDAFTQAMEKAAKSDATALTRQLEQLRDIAKAAADEGERLLKIQEQLANAKKGADLAEVENMPGATPAEKEARRQKIEDDAIAEKRKREDDALNQRYGEAKDAADRAQAAHQQQQAKRDELAGNIDAVAQRERDRRARLNQIDQEREQLGKFGNFEGTLEERWRRARRMTELADEKRALEKQAPTAEEKQAIAAQIKRRDEMDQALEKSRNDAEAAQAEYNKIAKQATDSNLPRIRSQEDKQRREEQKKRLGDLIDKEDAETEREYGPDTSPAARQRYRDLIERSKPREPSPGAQIHDSAPSANIGGKSFKAIEQETARGIEIIKNDGSVERLAAAASSLANAVEAKIVIDGKRMDAIARQLEQVVRRIDVHDGQLKTSARQSP